MRKRAVLVMGSGRSTLAAVRSLGRAGFRVVVGRAESSSPVVSQYSKYADDIWLHHPTMSRSSPGPFYESLEQLLDSQPDIACIFPVDNRHITFFAGTRAPERFPALAMADPAIYRMGVAKVPMLEVAERAGLSIPPWRSATNMAEVASAEAELDGTLIVKSTKDQRHVLGHKALTIHGGSNIESRLSDWPDGHDRLLVQRFVSGRRFNCYFAAHRGRLIAMTQIEVLRTDRRDGTGHSTYGLTMAAQAAVTESTSRLASALDYHGVGLAQFLVGPDGEASFLELNPRLGAGVAIPIKAGVNLPLLAVAIALDELEDPPQELSYQTGVRYQWLFGDLGGIRAGLREGLPKSEAMAWLREAFTSLGSADLHLLWDLRDPLPAAWRYSGVVRGRMDRLVRRKRGSRHE